MGMNPMLVSLFERHGVIQSQKSDLSHEVHRLLVRNSMRVERERSGWFNRRVLPSASVLVRLSHYDRNALIAHYRAKELRSLADAQHEGKPYHATLAIKRLKRVNEVEEAFADAGFER